MLGLTFITIHTLNRRGENERNVTLSCKKDGVMLLGNLEHGTKIVIDQTLVNQLQAIVNLNDYNVALHYEKVVEK